MNNQVIEVLNKDHGQEVKKYWESNGVDVDAFGFINNKENGKHKRYYGIVNDDFNNYTLEFVKRYNVEIIELPKTTEELPIPRDVLVRDKDNQTWTKRELLADLSEHNVIAPFVCKGQNTDILVIWNQMRELPTEITKDEAEKMLSELKGVEIKIK